MRFRRRPVAFAAVVICLNSGVGAAAADTSGTAPALEPAYSAAVADGWDCPSMLDSVNRLYAAYFGRYPDEDGFRYWAGVYGVERDTNLDVISEAFVASAEFQNTYGSLTNHQFVTLVYANVLGRAPDAGGLAHWVGALDRGYRRGAVMLAFSESAEFVTLTGTVTPLAGQLQWYGRDLFWDCSVGDSLAIAIPDDITDPHVDIVIANRSVGDLLDVHIGYVRVDGDGPNATLSVRWQRADGSRYSGPADPTGMIVPPGKYRFFWNEDVPAGTAEVWVSVASQTYEFDATVAVYSTPHSTARPGWDRVA